MTRPCHRHGVSPQLILGLAVMLLGLLLVLDNFGLLQARLVGRFWPLLLVGTGVLRLYYSLQAKAPPAGLALIAIGTGMLLINLGIVSSRQALAVFLLAAGAVMAWRAIGRRAPDDAQVPMVLDPARHLDLFAFMSYISRSVGDADFRGGHVTAFMGACEIDLRGARIEGGEAIVNIFAFWGGVEIRVPSDWVVESRGMAVLGAFEDRSHRADDQRQKLIVSGMVIMGGVEVKN
jgi:predicted membrane protein